MPWWQWLADIAGLCLLLIFGYALLLLVRRRLLTHGTGTFELSYRTRTDRSGRGWVLGLGRYEGDSLQFFRVFGALLRPMRTFARDTVTVRRRRQPLSAEQQVLYTGHVVVECSVAGKDVELAMSPEALTGLLAWLESAPPGRTPRSH